MTLRIVENAGHLSFLSELPKASPFRDPPGFDRPAAHAVILAEVTAFLDRYARG